MVKMHKKRMGNRLSRQKLKTYLPYYVMLIPGMTNFILCMGRPLHLRISA